MQVKKLQIENFRGFKSLDFELPSNLVVLIGVNGAGKSTILDALAVLLSKYSDQLLRRNRNEIELSEKDINVRAVGTKLAIEIETNFSRESNASWDVSLTRYPNLKFAYRTRVDKLSRLVRFYHFKELQKDQNSPLPILVYYQTHKIVIDPSVIQKKRSNSSNYKSLNQYAAYQRAFVNTETDFQDFFNWFEQEESYENEIRLREDMSFKNPRLEVIREALDSFLSELPGAHFQNLRIVRQKRENGFEFQNGSVQPSLVIDKNSEQLSIDQLADGEKAVLMLVLDIARRLAILNPGKPNSRSILAGEGVILIDEIDRHLHPAWQRSVIPGLLTTFPNCQFIVTTHSPQVLSNVRKENIFVLEDNKIWPADSPTFGRDTNAILSEIMQVTERPIEMKEHLRACFQLIDQGKLDEAKGELKKLSEQLGQHDSEIVRAQTLIDFFTRIHE